MAGDPIWLYDAKADGSAPQFHGELLLLHDRVVVPTDADPEGHLYAFDRGSGDLLWKLASDGGFATTPMLVDGRIVAVSARGEVGAVDPTSGDVLWREAPAGVLEPLPFIPSPAYAGDRLFIADNTGRVFALDAATGATLWQKALGARASTTLDVVGNTLVLGTIGGSTHWIATDSGATKHRVHLKEGHPYGMPIVASPLLFVLAAGEKGNLIALDATSGAIRWKQETPKEWTTYRPLVSGSTIIAGSADKNLCAFDRSSGEIQWCRPVGQVPRGLGISGDGILYVGSLSGLVQAFRFEGGGRR
jgi:outer membrane protein assembly factor BamB